MILSMVRVSQFLYFVILMIYIIAQQWRDVEVVDLSPCCRGAVKGKRGDSVSIHIVLSGIRNTHSTARVKYNTLFRVLFQKYCRLGGRSS